MAKKAISQTIKQIICIGMVIIVILPILLTVFAALKTKTAINTTSPIAFPAFDQITFENFKEVLSNKYLWIGFKNTLIILGISLFFNVLSGMGLLILKLSIVSATLI